MNEPLDFSTVTYCSCGREIARYHGTYPGTLIISAPPPCTHATMPYGRLPQGIQQPFAHPDAKRSKLGLGVGDHYEEVHTPLPLPSAPPPARIQEYGPVETWGNLEEPLA
jgi:hypothetical protein